MSKKKNFPLVLQKAIERLVYFRDHPHILRGRSGIFRAMRRERLDAIILILKTMLQMCTLQFNGVFCRVMKGGKARVVTAKELGEATGLHERTVWRVLHDLKDLNLLDTQKQFRFKCAEGLKVAPCIRQFTQRFWEMLNLWSLFAEGVRYAKKIGRLILHAPLKLLASNMSDIRNHYFMTATNCYDGKKPKKCHGGGQKKEICDLCHQFVQGTIIKSIGKQPSNVLI